jgi:GT2 family glycosyltransferase
VSCTLSFVIVNWNGGELLKRCLRSIARYPPAVDCEVVVVDNASTDGSVEWLHSAEARGLVAPIELRIIKNYENRGFGPANNQAFPQTQSPLLFLLNADAELTAGACDQLIKTVSSDKRIAACGPRLLNTDGSLQPSVWHNPPSAWEIIVSGLGLWRLIPRRVRGRLLLGGHWDHASRRIAPVIFGAAMLIKREVLEDVGGFDERFHMYGEDYEWCLRIRRAGWKIVFEPAANVIHHGAQFSLQRWTTLEKVRVQLEAGFKYYQICLSRRQSIANLAAACVVSFAQKNWYRLRGRPGDTAQTAWKLNTAQLKRTLLRID